MLRAGTHIEYIIYGESCILKTNHQNDCIQAMNIFIYLYSLPIGVARDFTFCTLTFVIIIIIIDVVVVVVIVVIDVGVAVDFADFMVADLTR